MITRSRYLSFGLLAAFLVSPSSAADVPPEAALREPTEFEFIETPLDEVARFLGDLHNVPIECDGEAFRKAGRKIDDESTNMTLSGIPLRNALNLITYQNRCEYRIEGKKIVIVPEPPKGTNGQKKPMPGPAAAMKAPITPASVRIREALKGKTELRFQQTPLKQGLAFVADIHNIQIVVDERGMKEANLAPETPLTHDSPANSTLEANLAMILAPLKLHAVIRDDVLFVTPKPTIPGK